MCCPASWRRSGNTTAAVEVTLDISLSEEIVVKILANELDLGLVSHEAHDARLSAKEFMTDELVAIAPSHHPWAGKKRIKPEELLGETFIAAARGAGTRAVVEERLKAKGIVLTDVVDFGNTEGVKRAVEAGLGVSIQSQQRGAAGDLCWLPDRRFLSRHGRQGCVLRSPSQGQAPFPCSEGVPGSALAGCGKSG